MGCDIHMVLERKTVREWVGVQTYPTVTKHSHSLSVAIPNLDLDWAESSWYAFPRVTSRNYELFASLAGVRGDGPEPKGEPDDISLLGRLTLDRWGFDAHSVTYYTLRECGVHFLNHYAPGDVLSEYRHKVLGSLFTVPEEEVDFNDEWLDNYRLIIFFDN